jgi:hypothetical protein
MKKLALVLAGVFALTAFGASAPPARAGDVNIGVSIGWNHGYGYRQQHHKRYYKHHRPYIAKRHHYAPKHYKRYYRHSYHGGGWGNHYYRSYGKRPCHPVYRDGYWRGRPAKLGGTMCYNGRGHSYVLRGSQYLIHFY